MLTDVGVERVYLACGSTDLRKWIDGLAAIVSHSFKLNPFSPCLFVFCNRLFAIERDLKDVSAEERYKCRLECSRPLLDEFSAWLDDQSLKTLPKSALGQAITYCHSQWSKLEAFLQDGRLELDNNRSERSIKPFVIGRKNWLFSNTPRGAQAGATIYSIVETAIENGVIPFDYLKHIFEVLPNMRITDLADLDRLLPWSEELPSACRIQMPWRIWYNGTGTINERR